MRRTKIGLLGVAAALTAVGSFQLSGASAAGGAPAGSARGVALGSGPAVLRHTVRRRSAAGLPDTTGEALWTYLEENDYQRWPLWPGKGRFFEGEEPHGALLTTYVDSVVYRALARDTDRMPVGSIIVKENFGRDSTLKGHTVMYKVPGYDAENHDWFWGQYAPDGRVIAAGRVEMCYQCHRVAAKYDDLWILRDQKYGGAAKAGRDR